MFRSKLIIEVLTPIWYIEQPVLTHDSTRADNTRLTPLQLSKIIGTYYIICELINPTFTPSWPSSPSKNNHFNLYYKQPVHFARTHSFIIPMPDKIKLFSRGLIVDTRTVAFRK